MNSEILPLELAALLESPARPHLLDIREPEEHEFVSLPNSKLLPLGQLTLRAAEIADWKDQEIVVYCHHGIRSLSAIAQLRSLGFSQLINLSGGIDQWTREVDRSLPRY